MLFVFFLPLALWQYMFESFAVWRGWNGNGKGQERVKSIEELLFLLLCKLDLAENVGAHAFLKMSCFICFYYCSWVGSLSPSCTS
jgi:hypothetical protein